MGEGDREKSDYRSDRERRGSRSDASYERKREKSSYRRDRERRGWRSDRADDRDKDRRGSKRDVRDREKSASKGNKDEGGSRRGSRSDSIQRSIESAPTSKSPMSRTASRLKEESKRREDTLDLAPAPATSGHAPVEPNGATSICSMPIGDNGLGKEDQSMESSLSRVTATTSSEITLETSSMVKTSSAGSFFSLSKASSKNQAASAPIVQPSSGPSLPGSAKTAMNFRARLQKAASLRQVNRSGTTNFGNASSRGIARTKSLSRGSSARDVKAPLQSTNGGTCPSGSSPHAGNAPGMSRTGLKKSGSAPTLTRIQYMRSAAGRPCLNKHGSERSLRSARSNHSRSNIRKKSTAESSTDFTRSESSLAFVDAAKDGTIEKAPIRSISRVGNASPGLTEEAGKGKVLPRSKSRSGHARPGSMHKSRGSLPDGNSKDNLPPALPANGAPNDSIEKGIEPGNTSTVQEHVTNPLTEYEAYLASHHSGSSDDDTDNDTDTDSDCTSSESDSDSDDEQSSVQSHNSCSEASLTLDEIKSDGAHALVSATNPELGNEPGGGPNQQAPGMQRCKPSSVKYLTEPEDLQQPRKALGQSARNLVGTAHKQGNSQRRSRSVTNVLEGKTTVQQPGHMQQRSRSARNLIRADAAAQQPGPLQGRSRSARDLVGQQAKNLQPGQLQRRSRSARDLTLQEATVQEPARPQRRSRSVRNILHRDGTAQQSSQSRRVPQDTRSSTLQLVNAESTEASSSSSSSCQDLPFGSREDGGRPGLMQSGNTSAAIQEGGGRPGLVKTSGERPGLVKSDNAAAPSQEGGRPGLARDTDTSAASGGTLGGKRAKRGSIKDIFSAMKGGFANTSSRRLLVTDEDRDAMRQDDQRDALNQILSKRRGGKTSTPRRGLGATSSGPVSASPTIATPVITSNTPAQEEEPPAVGVTATQMSMLKTGGRRGLSRAQSVTARQRSRRNMMSAGP